MPPDDLPDRLAGTLLGTALGDALGIALEGLPAPVIARRYGRVERFHLLGATGFVSDDTEQAALLAQSLGRHPDDAAACVRDFRRALLGWFLRLPWGIGRATLGASLRIAVGMRQSGVRSAGNGAAMRAGVLGVFFCDRPDPRRVWGRALAEVTHRDPRAVEGALYAAEVAAACALAPRGRHPAACLIPGRQVITVPSLRGAVDRALEAAGSGVPALDAARLIGTSGFVEHTIPFAVFCFARYGEEPLAALIEAVSAGGDTDTIGAVLGAWLGALHGEAGLPAPLLKRIHDGPFGPTHLRQLAACLASAREGSLVPVPAYSPAAALARNLALYPVILAHGFRRLLP